MSLGELFTLKKINSDAILTISNKFVNISKPNCRELQQHQKMPLGVQPVCSSCNATTSTMWNKGLDGDIICNMCAARLASGSKENAMNNGSCTTKKCNGNGDNGPGPVLRKSSRNKPSKYRLTNAKQIATKGKGRRIIFKKNQPMKAPTAVSTVVTGDSVYHDGQYYQVGDIVSLVDEEMEIYYAQIRGFLQDQYYAKSAVVTWLLPTSTWHRGMGFNPQTYILGPEEDLPRKLDCMEFVCHAPSDYYHAKRAPYPTLDPAPDLCYMWSALGPEIQIKPDQDEIYGMNIIERPSAPPPKKISKAERLKIKEEKKLIID